MRFLIYSIILLICSKSLATNQGELGKTVLEAAAKQAGLEKELTLTTNSLYNKLSNNEYKKYIDISAGIADTLIRKEVRLNRTWEF